MWEADRPPPCARGVLTFPLLLTSTSNIAPAVANSLDLSATHAMHAPDETSMSLWSGVMAMAESQGLGNSICWPTAPWAASVKSSVALCHTAPEVLRRSTTDRSLVSPAAVSVWAEEGRVTCEQNEDPVAARKPQNKRVTRSRMMGSAMLQLR